MPISKKIGGRSFISKNISGDKKILKRLFSYAYNHPWSGPVNTGNYTAAVKKSN